MYKKYLLLICIGSISCSFLTDNQKVENTIKTALQCVNTLDTNCIINLRATENIEKWSLVEDTKFAYYILNKYHKNNLDNINYTQDSVFDELGRIKVTIPILDGFDSLSGVSKVKLIIRIGPKQLFGLKKITGFEIENDVDVSYRKSLRLEGKLKDTDELLKTIK